MLYSSELSKPGAIYELLIDGKPACERICDEAPPNRDRAIEIVVRNQRLVPPSPNSAQGWQITSASIGMETTTIRLHTPEEDQFREPYYLFALKDLTANDQTANLRWLDTGTNMNYSTEIILQAGVCQPGYLLKTGHSYQLVIYEIFSGHSEKVTGWRFVFPKSSWFSQKWPWSSKKEPNEATRKNKDFTIEELHLKKLELKNLPSLPF